MIRRLLLHPHLGLALRLVVGATFVYAALYKIKEPQAFAQGVMDYRMVPSALIVPFAVILPWIEALAGATLMLGWLRRGSAVTILVMLVIFIVALATAIARGIDISCGCFHATAEGSRVAWITLWRDVLLVAGTLPLLLAPRTTLELVRGKRSTA
jgi:uncharacterized membrane protein YphA (DoxX/SURF4 family)